MAQTEATLRTVKFDEPTLPAGRRVTDVAPAAVGA